jgi:hypothetical protein
VIFRSKSKKKSVRFSDPVYIYYIVAHLSKIYEDYKNFDTGKGHVGRPSQHKYLGYYADILQEYLQANKLLKAKEGINISNQQAEFIYKFLKACSIIKEDPEDSTYEVGTIRAYLKKYRETDFYKERK